MDPMLLPIKYRLAFRERGLSIGLQAVKSLHGLIEEKSSLLRERSTLKECIEVLMQYTEVIEVIEDFWLKSTSREAKSWVDHRDINMIMLMTSQAPDGFLTI
jgi:hypothetical protein